MWTLQDAKARFSALVDAALAGEPQEVTRRGRPAVVVVGAEDWARMKGEGRASGFAAHLAAIPTGDDETDPFPRMAMDARPVDL